MNLQKVVLYAHAGSGNHGCEALANTICSMIKKRVLLVTNSVNEDERYSLRGKCDIVSEQNIRAHKLMHIFYYVYRKLTGDRESFLRYRFKNVLGNNSCLWNISIGGDNYCYESMVKDLMLANCMFHKNGGKTILFGCSIEPELLKDKEVLRDMMLYEAVFARESVTYEALKKEGVKNLYLYPDSAFLLKPKFLPLPVGFKEGNTVGINISPMIVENESDMGITMKNYEALIRYIIENTDMNVALIPHVVWERNDDRKTIDELYNSFREEERVVKIEDAGCEELKGYIARCRFFIGARTHATIAAYSTLVPTLVVGYSVKARGIAMDIFGSWEKYVEPVQQLKTQEQLLAAFQWLYKKEDDIKEILTKKMPSYIENARQAGEKLNQLIEADNLS